MTPEQELDLRMAEPDEGAVVRLTVQYPESPKIYTYAAVRIDGFWYLSGANAARKTWDELIVFFRTKNIEIISIKQATSWEDL